MFITRFFLISVLLLFYINGFAEEFRVSSPDGKLEVKLFLDQNKLFYIVYLNQKVMLEKSPLGIRGKYLDLFSNLTFDSKRMINIDNFYYEPKIKKSEVRYTASELTCRFKNAAKNELNVVFRVSNNNIAYRYHIPQTGEAANIIIEEELSGYNFPAGTTTFLTPQASPMIGWMKTKPSYEEEYIPEAAMGLPSKYGVGHTFPALFHLGESGWILLSETGVNGSYCGSKLSEGTSDGIYKIAFPEPGENNGLGSQNPSVSLPGFTPWRTITVGNSLKPIVETTIPFDVVEPQYKATKQYTFGRSTWSWLQWQDNSINFDDQKKFIDLSASMGYEFTLIDGLWDKQIGREKIEELVLYAKKKNVGVALWYNSNGFWNNAPQGPKNKMNTAIARKEEMAWMQRIGVKGIKVDFFGGDKQETMKLYEEILSDANTYGLTVIFHGCTLPRGWERMYPNFVGSEAVLASENLIFTQDSNDKEAFNASLHPFIRNAVGSMEFGPVLLNKYHNKENKGGKIRKTTETFQIATAVLFQSPVQNFGITPNNLFDTPLHIVEFMKNIPTIWDETVFIEGYPGKYCVIARRHKEQWFITAINAEGNKKYLNLSLPMLEQKNLSIYTDGDKREAKFRHLDIWKETKLKIRLLPEGGAVIVGQQKGISLNQSNIKK